MPKVRLVTPSTFGLGVLLGVAIVNSVGGVYLKRKSAVRVGQIAAQSSEGQQVA